MTERLFHPEKERTMRTYRFVLNLEVTAHDMIEAGTLVGKALGFADNLEIVEFEEAE
jgi:hypothetical protein